MTRPRILVAGIGNIFLGDDAFGVEVVRRLARRQLPQEVRVVDFGIRGLDLTYALLDDYDAVILVDAAPRGQTPGTLYVLEPAKCEAAAVPLETHNLDPIKVLRLAAALGGHIECLLLVGCEPSPIDEVEDMVEGLSAPVRSAVEEAVVLIEALTARLLQGELVGTMADALIFEKEVPLCRE